MPQSRIGLKIVRIMKRKYKIKFSLYYIGAWQFHVELPSLTSVIYGKKSQISIFSSTQKKIHVALILFERFFFYFEGNSMLYLLQLVASCTYCGQLHIFSFFISRDALSRQNILDWYTLPFAG